MNPDLLIAHFDRISSTPEAIPRLRRFILDLAVSGKLVEQDPEEEQSPEVRELLAKGSIASQAQIPVKWVRGTVGTLLNFQYGKALPENALLESGPTCVFGSNGVVGYSSDFLTENAAIIIGRKGSAGALNLSHGPSWTKDVAYFVEPPVFFDIKYLYFALQTLDLDQLGKGVKPGLSRGDAYRLYLSVPPPAEQLRIVSKVEELWVLCNRLEDTQRQCKLQRDGLATASHFYLNNASSSENLRPHISFYLEHLSELTAGAEQINALRQTILGLSMRGRLVSQDPDNENATLLLRRVADEIKTYAREQRISVARPSPVKDDEIPYSVPSGWAWTRLCSIFKVITDGDHQPPPKEEDGVAFLTIGNITTGSIDFSNCRFVSSSYLETVAEYRKPSCGDILYTVVGATYGRPVLVDTKRPFCVQRHIAILKPPEAIDTEFLRFLLASPLVYAQATRSATGAAQPTVALKPLRNFLVPLPPYAEQLRIVSRIEELFSLCGQLQSSSANAQHANRLLLESVLHQALRPTSPRTAQAVDEKARTIGTLERASLPT